MPPTIKWNAEADAKLFLGVLNQIKDAKVKLDYDKLAEFMGQGCVPGAIVNRIVRLKKKAESEAGESVNGEIDDGNDNDNGSGNAELGVSPQKRKVGAKPRGGGSAKGKGRRKKVKVRDEDEDGDGEEFKGSKVKVEVKEQEDSDDEDLG